MCALAQEELPKQAFNIGVKKFQLCLIFSNRIKTCLHTNLKLLDQAELILMKKTLTGTSAYNNDFYHHFNYFDLFRITLDIVCACTPPYPFHKTQFVFGVVLLSLCFDITKIISMFLHFPCGKKRSQQSQSMPPFKFDFTITLNFINFAKGSSSSYLP